MSINKFNYLLIIICLGIGCWARPKRLQQADASLNEVIPLEADISNHLIEELSTLASTRGNYRKRHSFNPYKQKLFRRRYYNAPTAGYSEVGGANYYSNDFLPLSNYEILEPQTIYY